MNTNTYNEALCTPYELFGIECGNGWLKLLEPIFEYVENYNKDKDEKHKIKFTQIKEKWARLEIYTNFVTRELDDLIEEAGDKSENVCEICGSEENVGCRITGWYTTMCLDCLKKEIKGKKYNQIWVRNSDNKKIIVKQDGTTEEV